MMPQPPLRGASALTWAALAVAHVGLYWLLIEWLGWPRPAAGLLSAALLLSLGLLANGLLVLARARPPVDRAGPPRVLQVSAFFPAHGGGIEVVAGQLAAQLARQGIDITWMAGGPEREWPGPGAFTGVRILPARGVDFVERRLGLPAPLWGPASIRELWREVRRADLVHVHDYLYQPSLLAVIFARLLSRPIVLTQHVGDIRYASRVATSILRILNRTLGPVVMRRSSQVAFVGEPVRRQFLGRLRFHKPPLVIPNGVDHSLNRASTVPAHAGPLRALFVGRFVEKKGLGLLQQVVPGSGMHWTFVGRGPLSPEAWPPIEGASLHTAGPLLPEQVADAMRAADLLVLPSTGEGFPLVVQEALACGTPVLVSREVAEAFPVIDRNCVFDADLQGPDPVAALREALNRLSRDPDLLRAARSSAAALAAQWSWQRCAETYLHIYRQLIAEKDPIHVHVPAAG